MRVFDFPQGGEKWRAIRAGKPTASNFDKILTAGGKGWKPGDKKGEPRKSEQWDGYMDHLLAERILNAPIDGPKTQAMFEGNQFEYSAVAAYEMQHDCETEKIGFVLRDGEDIGCSPDRLIIGCSDGMVEAKCPEPKGIVRYLRASTGASDEYKVQLQGQLWVCDRQWVDIVAYRPQFPTCIFRVQRDEEYIKLLAAHVRDFNRQLEEQAALFTERGWIKEPEVPRAEENPFLTAEDIAWAKDRFKGETNAK